jgi:hypothetical protein
LGHGCSADEEPDDSAYRRHHAVLITPRLFLPEPLIDPWDSGIFKLNNAGNRNLNCSDRAALQLNGWGMPTLVQQTMGGCSTRMRAVLWKVLMRLALSAGSLSQSQRQVQRYHSTTKRSRKRKPSARRTYSSRLELDVLVTNLQGYRHRSASVLTCSGGMITGTTFPPRDTGTAVRPIDH